MNQHVIRKMTDRKRPTVGMSGEDCSMFALLIRTREAMRNVGWSDAEIADATNDMLSDDHDHLVDLVYALCDVA